MQEKARDLKGIFMAQRPLLLRMLTARLQNADDAEDVLQDLWLKLDDMILRPIRAPVPLLFRAAANLATDKRIAASRRYARDSNWAAGQPSAQEVPGADRTLVARQEWEMMKKAVQRLPPRMAAALRLYRIEGMGQRDIAAELGVSLSAVEKLLHKAYAEILTINDDKGAESEGSCRHHGKGKMLGDD